MPDPIVDPVDPVLISDEVVVVKEDTKYFAKKQIDIDKEIANQQALIVSLNEQIQRANDTLIELQSIK